MLGLALILGLVAVSSAATMVSVSGSTSLLPLAERWAEEFNQMQSDYEVSVRAGGSGVGIKDVASGKVDIGMASREVKPEEISSLGDKFVEHKVAIDCISLVVSAAVYDSGVTGLTYDQVRGIYDGSIDNWKDIGGEDAEIYTISREVGSGTRDYFNEFFFGSSKVELEVGSIEGGNAGIVTAVGQNSDVGIGYVSLKFINAKGVRAVAYDGVTPSMESAMDGSYPISRPLYMYTYGETSDGAQAFLDFILSPEGQEMAKEEGYPPAA
ncbi:MAG: phosphate ABC transporter periplasmic substrate-binding protein PstS [Methanosaeta sp. PtaB.Bin039]|nr:MAG: phosphate ABC transporter periplasmic substrate-binding protein PstS [Methanosaeta sp. PtaB.Bin039]OPY45771.1 MAG: phosphate ABC transporter periplasmic substrate-binding protein PstS [Methanosaeta sp. PtaU1.Bin028]